MRTRSPSMAGSLYTTDLRRPVIEIISTDMALAASRNTGMESFLPVRKVSVTGIRPVVGLHAPKDTLAKLTTPLSS